MAGATVAAMAAITGGEDEGVIINGDNGAACSVRAPDTVTRTKVFSPGYGIHPPTL